MLTGRFFPWLSLAIAVMLSASVWSAEGQAAPAAPTCKSVITPGAHGYTVAGSEVAIALEGGNSKGDGLSYTWNLAKPVPGARIDNADKPSATLVVSNIGRYAVQLTVTAADGTSHTAGSHAFALIDPARFEGFASAGATKFLYKEAADRFGTKHSLYLHVFKPEGWTAEDKRPAVVAFHGGSWSIGDATMYEAQCRDFARRGLVAISVEYRVNSRHGSDPADAVRDARSAMRWVRSYAGQLGVDPIHIAPTGFSAGGHLAVSTALADGCDDSGDDLAVSPRPDALVLLCPALVTPDKTISPMLLVKVGMPPTLIMVGDKDNTTPAKVCQDFATKVKDQGNTCEIEVYPGIAHVPFGLETPSVYGDVMARSIALLTGAGFQLDTAAK